MVIHWHKQWQEAYIPCWGWISNTALVLYKLSFHDLFSATVFTFLCAFWWWIRHLKWPSSIVLKSCLAVLRRSSWCAWQDIRVLDKLCSGVSYTAVGCDFKVDAPTIYIEQLLLLLSHFSHVQFCATRQTAAHQAPPSLGFSRQEHGSGLPFPSPMHESEKWKWKVKSESEVAQSCPTLGTPWTAAYQAPPSMGFSRQEYWSGLPFPSIQGIFPTQGLNLGLPAGRFRIFNNLSHQGSPHDLS